MILRTSFARPPSNRMSLSAISRMPKRGYNSFSTAPFSGRYHIPAASSLSSTAFRSASSRAILLWAMAASWMKRGSRTPPASRAMAAAALSLCRCEAVSRRSRSMPDTLCASGFSRFTAQPARYATSSMADWYSLFVMPFHVLFG